MEFENHFYWMSQRLRQSLEIQEEMEIISQDPDLNLLEKKCRMYKLCKELCDLYEIPYNILKHPEQE